MEDADVVSELQTQLVNLRQAGKAAISGYISKAENQEADTSAYRGALAVDYLGQVSSDSSIVLKST